MYRRWTLTVVGQWLRTNCMIPFLFSICFLRREHACHTFPSWLPSWTQMHKVLRFTTLTIYNSRGLSTEHVLLVEKAQAYVASKMSPRRTDTLGVMEHILLVSPLVISDSAMYIFTFIIHLCLNFSLFSLNIQTSVFYSKACMHLDDSCHSNWN